MDEPSYPLRLGRWRVAQILTERGRDLDGVLLAFQEHKGVVIGADECVSGETGADGIMVQKVRQPVAVLTADCMPLVVTTETEAVVLHVSRKSLIYGLLDKVEDMIDLTRVREVYVGPHICPHHFKFERLGDELRQFQMLFPCAMSWNESREVSLRAAVQSYFDQWGVAVERLVIDDRCTYECRELPSYRRSLAEDMSPYTRRLATVVWGE